MSDWFYRSVVALGRPVFWLVTRRVALHQDRARGPGGYILASNHLSPYDVPCLMEATPRVLDFVSIVEVFRVPFVGWFFRKMGAFPLNRGRVDARTTRVILDRLRRGRVVAMFPEGRIRTLRESVLKGRRPRSGLARLAELADVPVVPCAVLGSENFRGITSWLPLRRTYYAVAFGEPLRVRGDLERREAHALLERQWCESVVALNRELLDAVQDPRMRRRLWPEAEEPSAM